MLLARLLTKIFNKNGVILIDSQGQKYICGKPNLNNPLTLKLKCDDKKEEKNSLLLKLNKMFEKTPTSHVA